MNNSVLILVLALSFQQFGCGGENKSLVIEANRTREGNLQQLDKVKLDAIKGGAYLKTESKSLQLLEVKDDSLTVGMTFLLNSKSLGYRTFIFPLKKNEERTWENRSLDLTAQSRLRIHGLRTSLENHPDVLALHFMFENRTREPVTNSSYLLLIRLDSREMSTLKEAFYYPQINSLELRKWVDGVGNSTLGDIKLEL